MVNKEILGDVSLDVIGFGLISFGFLKLQSNPATLQDWAVVGVSFGVGVLFLYLKNHLVFKRFHR